MVAALPRNAKVIVAEDGVLGPAMMWPKAMSKFPSYIGNLPFNLRSSSRNAKVAEDGSDEMGVG